MDHFGLKVIHADVFPVVMEGTFEIDGPKGRVDAYEIRIEFPEAFPRVPPAVFETTGRLPHDLDRHVFGDGRACLEVWPVWRAQNPDATVRSVLNGPVRNFLLSQSIFESSGSWPFGEYSHGDAGQREALRDILKATGTGDKDLLWRANALVNPPRRQNSCPCGGGRLYRKCHRQELEGLATSLDSAGIWLITDMYLDMLKRTDSAN